MTRPLFCPLLPFSAGFRSPRISCWPHPSVPFPRSGPKDISPLFRRTPATPRRRAQPNFVLLLSLKSWKDERKFLLAFERLDGGAESSSPRTSCLFPPSDLEHFPLLVFSSLRSFSECSQSISPPPIGQDRVYNLRESRSLNIFSIWHPFRNLQTAAIDFLYSRPLFSE